jgi:hypothetical protein
MLLDFVWMDRGWSKPSTRLICPTLAVFRRKGVILTIPQTSLLAKPAIDMVLRSAKACLAQDGYLAPALFLRMEDGNTMIFPLMLPDDFEQKVNHFLILGRRLQEDHLAPTEAVFLSESWFVNVQDTSAATQFAPSKHPARQEAIVAIGRSADNRRFTQVVQPFTRDKGNHPVWLPIPLAQYNSERLPHEGPVGLLDYLFAEIPKCA